VNTSFIKNELIPLASTITISVGKAPCLSLFYFYKVSINKVTLEIENVHGRMLLYSLLKCLNYEVINPTPLKTSPAKNLTLFLNLFPTRVLNQFSMLLTGAGISFILGSKPTEKCQGMSRHQLHFKTFCMNSLPSSITLQDFMHEQL
jgi:hypothetical protein